MSKQLTVDDFKQSLNSHAASKGDEIRQKYGPEISWGKLQSILEDRSIVRYPCELVFDSTPLLPGEFACPICLGATPEDGFKLYVHPYFLLEMGNIPHLVLYQLVAVNYGDFASAADAETFGARALGLSEEEYYEELCELVDRMNLAGMPPGVNCSG